jgi:uncharacterized protein (TIGR02466 family)
MLVNVTPELSVIFGTPIAVRTVANFQTLSAALEQAILNRARSGIGNQLSNIGGWQSQTDFLDWPEPAISQFRSELDRSIQSISTVPVLLEGRTPDPSTRVGYSAYGWTNINKDGDYNTLHVHPGCDWSSVYYVSPGTPNPDTPTNGRIEFRDPRPSAAYARIPGFTSGQPMRLKPQAGLLVVFPSWLEHWVHPYFGEGHRISISVNVTLNRE